MRGSSVFIGVVFALAGIAGTTGASAGGAPKALSKQCGSVRVTITCARNNGDCTQTTLTLTTADGQSEVLSKPRGLADFTAVALACVSSRDHEDYFSVQYGSLPSGCEFCEWEALYSKKGEPLTNNDPAVLTDTTLPEGHQQYPNNQEYDEAFEKLGLSKPKYEVFFP